jgi:hypothetical protein
MPWSRLLAKRSPLLQGYISPLDSLSLFCFPTTIYSILIASKVLVLCSSIMRLLSTVSRGGVYKSSEFLQPSVPSYAILSHTWGSASDEISFQDMMNGTGSNKPGYTKLKFCAKWAFKDGLTLMWIDTCCIDTSSSAELSEAVISMFRWYNRASKCYVYLSDVSSKNMSKGHLDGWKAAFRRSRWFTRSWTLQELIAPPEVLFFSHEGQFLGDKVSLQTEIHEITGIPVEALRGSPLSLYSVEERLNWAQHRQCTRPEDRAYSLMGVFDVAMPLLYGEGKTNAFARLQREIATSGQYQVGNNNFVTPEATSSTKSQSIIESLQDWDDDIVHLSPGSLVDSTENIGQVSYLRTLPDFGFRVFILEAGAFGERIVGRLQEFSLLNPPAFNALSYFWGQEPAIHPIVINGIPALVRPNVFQALQRIRLRTGQIHLWVDSLCINQSDDVERSGQVKQMSTIYQKADGVLIWLGEEDSTSKMAMGFIKKVVKNDFRWESNWWEQYGFTALAHALERPWFRRGWVIQEAAFSTNSTVYCGDRQVHMDEFEMATNLVRARLNSVPASISHTGNAKRAGILSNFDDDSPAIRLLDTVYSAFRKSANGAIMYPLLSLETLVELGTFTETSDHRDTIYALLNLANDIASLSEPEKTDTIVPDYRKDPLDIYADFIMHCCRYSGSLDILCRPWAPTWSSAMNPANKNNEINSQPRQYPSWIASRDRLPFGNPSWRLKHRMHGNPLVGSSRNQNRIYNAHYGTKPQVSMGRKEISGSCDRSLYARGIVLGEIAQRSTRLADAIITKECLEVLGKSSRPSGTGRINLPDTIWRTLCAGRGGKGESVQRFFRAAMLHLLQISSPEGAEDLLEHMSSIDIEELLETNIPDHVKRFLEVVRDVIWNRRTFRSRENKGSEAPLIGLIPQDAKIGDQLCILYGCSVPVVLRKLPSTKNELCWQLIGDAYVDGHMDGEAIRFASPTTLESSEHDFKLF